MLWEGPGCFVTAKQGEEIIYAEGYPRGLVCESLSLMRGVSVAVVTEDWLHTGRLIR